MSTTPGQPTVADAHERVVLVDAKGRNRGSASKLEAHRYGVRHRALSVVICNDRGEMLLQQRAPGKYHSAGLWANACCGHPRPGERVDAAALRRLREEMGFTCALRPLGTVSYRVAVGERLIENELAHLYFGRYRGPVRPHPAEVAQYRWWAADELETAVVTEPERFAPWFKLYLASPLLAPASRR